MRSILQGMKNWRLLTGRRRRMNNQQIMIEPIVPRSVQSSMGRLKTIIASLLPALWLVTLVQCPLESPAFSFPSNCGAPGNSTGESAPVPGHSCYSADEYVRCHWRRGGGERAQVATRRLEPVSTDHPVSLRSFTPAIPLAGDAFLLQQRWQFVWRTADSPRAPSFLV
jgi:hypothetical protein